MSFLFAGLTIRFLGHQWAKYLLTLQGLTLIGGTVGNFGLGIDPDCTPQSGYYQVPGIIINVPLKNVAEASRILRWANTLEEERLLEMQSINFRALDDWYTYDRVAIQVIDAIESNESSRIVSHPLRRAALLYYALTAYYSYPGSPLFELATKANAPLRRYPLLYRALRFMHRRVCALLDAHYGG